MKILAPEMLGRPTDVTLQLLGGRGFIETNVIARFYRDARILRIFEGPANTLAAFLGACLRVNSSAFLQTLGALGGEAQVEQSTTLLEKWYQHLAGLSLAD